ncbi:MAG TPA: GspMb/PilO family protein [Fimbriimonas sp.]|nr:GspMb/PilO family protein [Fimbriimonas sp.]
MDLRRNPELGWNVLLGISLVAIVLIGILGFTKPTEPEEMMRHRSQKSQSSFSIKDSNDASQKAIAAIRKRTWDMSAEQLGPELMQRLNRIADDHHVVLSNFRSGHTSDVAALSEAPFIATVDGSFTDIVGFLQALEQPETKLAVNILQITASDQGVGKVTATISLMAFMVKEGI